MKSEMLQSGSKHRSECPCITYPVVEVADSANNAGKCFWDKGPQVWGPVKGPSTTIPEAGLSVEL